MYRILCGLFVFYSVNTNAKPCEFMPYTPEFIAGHYQLIARHPDSMKTYSANVHLNSSKNGKTVFMVEQVNKSSKRRWQGQFRPASPGEGCVLELESTPYEMSCLVSVDLDNNARLTCHWGWKDKGMTKPGLAALFPM